MVDYSDLNKLIKHDVECFVFDSIASTNMHLCDLKPSNTTQVCIAREQTQGKGQYERHWLSKKDASILFSVRRVFPARLNINGFSLVIGLAVLSVLQEYGVKQVKLKWPNDVYVKDQKIAGILIENSIQGDQQSMVIGLGLNVDLGDNFQCETPWTDLKRSSKQKIDLTLLSSELINNILHYCDLFETHGVEQFQQQWQMYDYLKGSKLALDYQNKTMQGVARGIADDGALLIEVDGQLISQYSSEQIRLI